MSRTLTFKEEAAIRRAGRVEVVCSEADGGRVFHLTAERLAQYFDEQDFPAIIRALIDEGAVLPGFVMPSRFMPKIVMRASPKIRQLLARAMHEDEHHD